MSQLSLIKQEPASINQQNCIFDTVTRCSHGFNMFSPYSFRRTSTVGSYHLRIVLSKKRKQQLKQMTAQSIETRKLQKANEETRQQINMLRRQREDKNRWDEYEDPCSESSSDKSDCDKLSSDESSSDEENMVIKDNRVMEETLVEGDNTFEGLGESNGRVQFKGKKRVFNLSWRPGADDYLQQI